MLKNIFKTTMFTVCLTILITSCRSNNEYKKLSEAGAKYAEAVDQLLQVAGDIRVNSTSEQLLKDDRILNQSVNDYTRLSQLDAERFEILKDLRNHNKLLKKYFERLQELATSDAPEEVQKEVGGIANNLNQIGQKLRGSDLVSNKEVFQGIAGFIVSSQIRGALREELEKRGQTIALELKTQQELLNALGDSIDQDVKLINMAQEQRLVIRPLTQPEPIASEDAWIKTRREVFNIQRNASQLREASNALQEFDDVFRAFVEGASSEERINTLLADIESFLLIAETLK